MYSSQSLKWILWLLIMFFHSPLLAQSTMNLEEVFVAKPNKCVALNQGRECFTKVTVSWARKEIGDYCLAELPVGDEVRQITCWDNVRQGYWEYEFQSSKDVQIILIKQGREQPVAQTTIKISWLYKGTARKRRWRLF